MAPIVRSFCTARPALAGHRCTGMQHGFGFSLAVANGLHSRFAVRAQVLLHGKSGGQTPLGLAYRLRAPGRLTIRTGVTQGTILLGFNHPLDGWSRTRL